MLSEQESLCTQLDWLEAHQTQLYFGSAVWHLLQSERPTEQLYKVTVIHRTLRVSAVWNGVRTRTIKTKLLWVRVWFLNKSEAKKDQQRLVLNTHSGSRKGCMRFISWEVGLYIDSHIKYITTHNVCMCNSFHLYCLRSSCFLTANKLIS